MREAVERCQRAGVKVECLYSFNAFIATISGLTSGIFNTEY